MNIVEIFIRLAIIAWCILVIWWVVYGVFLLRPINIKHSFLKLIGKKITYEKHKVGGDMRTKSQQALIKKNQNLLSENQVPLNKVKFVFQPNFEYDVDNNVINPQYNIYLPINVNTGEYDTETPVIAEGKPGSIMAVSVGSYQTADNYAYIKELLKRTKIGIAIFISDEVLSDGTPYCHSVSDETVRLAVLDDAVEHFKSAK